MNKVNSEISALAAVNQIKKTQIIKLAKELQMKFDNSQSKSPKFKKLRARLTKIQQSNLEDLSLGDLDTIDTILLDLIHIDKDLAL